MNRKDTENGVAAVEITAEKFFAPPDVPPVPSLSGSGGTTTGEGQK